MFQKDRTREKKNFPIERERERERNFERERGCELLSLPLLKFTCFLIFYDQITMMISERERNEIEWREKMEERKKRKRKK